MFRSGMTRRSFLLSPPLLVVAGAGATAEAATPGLAITPDALLRDAKRVDFKGQNAISVVSTNGTKMLRSTPHASASGLYLEVDVAPERLRRVSWSWLVDPMHRSADLRRSDAEDAGAVIMFVFGQPSILNRDVPTLAYAWSSTHVANGTVLPSVHYGSLRYVQLRGSADVGALQHEERDVVADFQAIFGRAPPELGYVAVFNDNDQTHEPVSALFGGITST